MRLLAEFGGALVIAQAAPLDVHFRPRIRPRSRAGSLMASHVSDGGFWLVKEYFGMSVQQTVATWTAMETIIAVAGLGGVLLFALVAG